MSLVLPTSTSSNFQLIFDNALKAYKKRTRNDLLTHPLADRFEACDSASSFLAVLQEEVRELDQSQRINIKWLDPTVNVIHTFSETLGEGVGSVCFRTELVRDLPSHICLTGILTCKGHFYRVWCSSFSAYPSSYLCADHPNTYDSQTAKAVRADQDALSEMFERIEAFFRRLDIYTKVAPNQGMAETITAIMVEVLNFIGIVTKEIKQGRTSNCFLYR
jgi:hypothetical protein